MNQNKLDELSLLTDGSGLKVTQNSKVDIELLHYISIHFVDVEIF